MLYYSFFDCDKMLCRICTPYSVRCTPYSVSEIHEKVYTLLKNLKIRLIVPINMIFSKTVSSLFVFKIINNYLRIRKTENGFFTLSCLFFLKLSENGVRSTEYGVRFLSSSGV